MDFHMKQWRDHQDESEEQPSAPPKMPKLLLQPPHQLFQNQRQEASSASALPLFVPEAPSSTKISSHLSAQPDSTPATTTTAILPRVGGYFSLAQWQELELQALIYRHMVAGAAIPPELLQLVKKSLLNSPYFLHHTTQHNLSLPYFHPTPGCWLRAAMDPEPGRCRRTDGKKWRCSRDVVAGQKYCERHMHRGRSRSRKPVEFPVPTATATSAAATSVLADGGADAARGVGGGGVGVVGPTSAAAAAVPCDSIFSLSGTTASVDTHHFNQGSAESRPAKKKGAFEPQHEASDDNDRVLRHFFDDWPRSIQDTNATGSSSQGTSAMHLSISAPGNPCPDFLKLSTGGNEDERGGRPGLHWTAAGWAAGGGSGQATPVGGPLAEALRSSSNSSPTSVLHQTLRCSASGSRFVST